MAKIGERFVARWTPRGAGLLSVEQGEGGYLGVDYADGVDTRWEIETTLGPLLNTLSCAAAGGTVANVNGMAVAPITMQAAGPFLYAIRGTKWAKVAMTGGASALTLSSDDTEGALGEAATGILHVKNAAGTEEILITMDNTIARIITAVGAGATDTDIAQTGNYKWTVAGFGDSDAAVQVVLLAGRGTGTPQNLIHQVALSGSTVLSTATPTLRATIAGPPLVFKSIAMDGDKILIGTDRGPIYLNNQSQAFRPLIGWLAPDSGNCTPMALWATGLGTSVIIALKRALRWSKNVINGGSFGPETYPENTSPVSGTCTAFAQSDRWGYFAFYNTKDDITYLCAARDRDLQDWQRGRAVSYFPLMTLGAGIECHSALYTGTEGNTARTLGMVVLGLDSNLGYFDEGRGDRFYEDTAYPYAALGTLYLTEMRRQADFYKDINFFIVETENCTDDETITLSVTCTDRFGTSSTTPIGGAIKGNGVHFLQVKGVTELTQARFVKPQIAFARGATTTNSPRVKGDILMDYTLQAIPRG